MHALVEPLLVLVLLLNLAVLGTSRMRAVIWGSAAQGALLGAVALVDSAGALRPLLLALAALLLKGALIPWLLQRAMRDVAIRREVEPLVGYVPSLLAGAGGTALAVVFAGTLPLAPQHQDSLLVPTALATVFTGFLLHTTRRKAITQAVGYLVLENGVFVMGLALVESLPGLVEMGVLLDLLVAVFVMAVIIRHIQRQLDSLDTTRLSQLKE